MRRSGFTLVEMLVVLVIVGILVSLVLPNALNAIRQGNQKECAANMRNIDTAMQQCYTQTRNWTRCDSQAELTAGNYLEATAVCPFAMAYNIPLALNAGTPTAVTKFTHFSGWPDLDPNTVANH